MKMLYTANGRYIRCCTEEGTRPVIIVCEKDCLLYTSDAADEL